jgi:hypothetical protein
MYPLHTRQTQFTQENLNFILEKDFSVSQTEGTAKDRLRSIADLAYDLLSRIQKSEKLRKLGQLGKSGEAEFDSNVRLVGLMVHLLRQYKYQDGEMMASLEKKYLQISPSIAGTQV